MHLHTEFCDPNVSDLFKVNGTLSGKATLSFPLLPGSSSSVVDNPLDCQSRDRKINTPLLPSFG